MGGRTRLGRAVREHAAFLRARLRSLGVDEARLDDAAQDVLEVLARRIEAYDERWSVRQWMAGVARNVARKHRRSAMQEPAVLEVEPADADDPERAAVRREAAEMLERFLGELDPDRWAVFVLSEIEGLRGTEIAAELGVNLSTVYARLRSAQRTFDRTLARYRARERGFAWLAIFVPRPATSLAAVSTRVLVAIVIAVIGVAVTTWIVARREPVVATASVARRSGGDVPPSPRAASVASRRAIDDAPVEVERPPRVPAPAPASLGDAQQTAIAAFAELYRSFDDDRYRALFDAAAEPWVLREQLEWFSSVLGDCGPPEPLHVASDTAARFVFRCDTGELEAAIVLVDATTPRIRELRSGVRGVDPPEVVLSAAQRALALYHAFDAAAVPSLFADDFDTAEIEAELAGIRDAWGTCTLGDVDLARHRGALFDLHCDAGLRLMKLELAEDDRIAILVFDAARQETIREG